MESKIAKALGLRYEPVASLWEDERPGGALGFKPGRFGCVMSLLPLLHKRGALPPSIVRPMAVGEVAWD